jgi:hypothetical protein
MRSLKVFARQRLVAGPYIYVWYFSIILILCSTCQQLTGEDSYQIAVAGVQGTRVEIVSDAPPPPDEPP